MEHSGSWLFHDRATCPAPVQFPRLGFAFFCRRKMAILLIQRMLDVFVFG
jgi:hypothetical protein